MAALVAGAALTAAVGLNFTDALFSTNNERSWKSKTIKIKAPCHITEEMDDDYTVTDNPTEMGTLISDHMFAQPKRVNIELVYSISGASYALKAVGAALGYGSTPSSVKNYYDQFLSLQASRTPFDITTGKRLFKNMVITSIKNRTDVSSENYLRLSITAREVIIVKTSVKTDPAYQKDAANTADPVNNGNVSLK